jgi:hypothetical protein
MEAQISSWVNPKYKNEKFYPEVLCISAPLTEYAEVDKLGNETGRMKAEFLPEYMYGFHLLKPTKMEFTCHNSPFCSIDILYHLN